MRYLYLFGSMIFFPFAGTVYAQPTQEQFRACKSETRGAKATRAEDKIAACSVIIDFIPLKPRTLSWTYIYRSNAYSELENNNHALADAEEAIRVDVSNAYAWAKSCSLYNWKMNKREQALERCNTALKLNPKDGGAWTHRGDVYLNAKQYPEAIKDYNKAIKFAPKWMWPRINRGVAYRRSGNLALAEADFNEAARLSPDFAMGYLERGKTRIKMQRLDEAFADFEQGMNIETLCAECFYGRGLVKYEKGDLEGASLDLATAERLNPLSSKEFEEEGFKMPR